MPKLKLILSLSSFFLFIIFTLSIAKAQTTTVPDNINPNERDLIAFRILPNENNLSIFDWYQQQGFTGSPQSLTVDGYNAIRDGRTVYVNAANIYDGKLYTNIYLISYNQEPDVQTIDIFGGIVDNWKFNDNLSAPGSCNIETKICSDDFDCLDNEFCIDNRCRLNDGVSCLTDNHCPSGYYCNSEKAKVIRDTKRLGIFNTLKSNLDNFNQAYNFYPMLGAGTYVQYNSVSTWPSWQDQVLSPISANLNLIDPINSLGSCPESYDQYTCFDTDSKKFNTSTSTDIVLPSDSYVFAYQGNNYGTDYTLCASFETNYQLQNGDLNSITCPADAIAHNASNTAPYIESYYLQGEAYQEFNGFIKIKDDENHPLKSVTYDTVVTNFGLWHNSSKPEIQNTNNPLQKRLYSQQAGKVGNYPIKIKTEDIYGAATTTNLTIKIGNPAPFIEVDSFDYYVNPNPEKPLKFTIKMTDKNQPIIYDLTKQNTTIPDIDVNSLSISTTTIGNTLYATYEGNIDTALTIQNDLTLKYEVEAEDSLGASSTHQFDINLKTTPPIMDFVCSSQARSGQNYSCALGPEKRGDFTIDYTQTGLPAGLSLATVTDVYQFLHDQQANQQQTTTQNIFKRILSFFQNIFNFKTNTSLANTTNSYWVISGSSTATGSHEIIITAKNDYNTESTRSFTLNVNTYCGDDIIQLPNTEGRGGYYNDGYEDCDMTQNVALTATSSSISEQYGCTTNSVDNSPYPILNGNHCVFKDPLNGGGFCGDGFCQTVYEHSINCEEDCGPYCGYDVIYQGKTYPTVRIADQCWLAKNLDVGTRIDGGGNQGSSATDIKKYCYDDLNSNCDLYGALYQWDQAMAGSSEEGAQGICPDGWHVPKDAEWTVLTDYLKNDNQYYCGGNASYIAKSLAGNSGWNESVVNCAVGNDLEENNILNFAILGAGIRTTSSATRFTALGDQMHTWSSSGSGAIASRISLAFDSATVASGSSISKNYGASIRCLKDEPVLLQYFNVNYIAGNGGSISGDTSQLVLFGEDGAQVNASPIVGHHFVDWSDGLASSTRQEFNVRENLEFTANFAINEYTISFDGNGNTGGTVPTDIIVNHGSSFVMPEVAFNKLGHNFLNWNTQLDGSGQAYLPGEIYNNISDNLTFYAQWEMVAYVLQYSAQANGQIVGSSSQVVMFGGSGEEVEAQSTDPNYYFVGWSDNGSLDSLRKDENVSTNITAEAQFHTCGGEFEYAGSTYSRVLIGSQCWLGQNLNIGTKINNHTNSQLNNAIIEKWCINNQESKCDIYGGLYQWGEAVQYVNGSSNSTHWNPAPSEPVQGICPDGWYIPTLSDFDTLLGFLGSNASRKLKSCLTHNHPDGPTSDCYVSSLNNDPVWWNSSYYGWDNFNFSAFPGGQVTHSQHFSNVRSHAYYWLSTLNHFQVGRAHGFSIDRNNNVLDDFTHKVSGRSIRCIRDE